MHYSAHTVSPRRAEVPPAVEIQRVTKTFAATRALSDVSLTISPGEIHALVGENGSGKSTLIKVITGYHAPDHGSTVRIAGSPLHPGDGTSAYRLGVRVVHQELGLVESCTVADNLCLGIGFPTRAATVDRKGLHLAAQKDLARAGTPIDPSATVADLSAAERTGVAIARALKPNREYPTRLLILDEPTATLPDGEVAHLLEIVRAVAARGVAVLYVSHRLDEIFAVAERVSVLRNGVLVHQSEIDSVTRSDLINLLVGQELEPVPAAPTTSPATAGRPALEVDHVAAGPLRDASFSVQAGEIVGLAGLTGSGRESVLGALFGQRPRRAGTVTVNGRRLVASRPDLAIERGLAYVPADRKTAGAVLTMTAAENLTLSDLRPVRTRLRVSRRREEREAQHWFDRLAVRPSRQTNRQLQLFSGGNQQKVVLAKWLRCNPLVILLDEPTHGVDVAARSIVHRQLVEAASKGAAVVISSADTDELVTLCHRVLVFRRGRIVASVRPPDISVATITQLAMHEVPTDND